MRTVTAQVARLRQTLEQNRDEHRATFERAMDRYRELAIERLSANIEEVRRGGPIRTFLDLPTPEDHTEDYERALQMLDWHQRQEIELTQQEFAQFVQDNWGWRQSFLANTASYTQEV